MTQQPHVDDDPKVIKSGTHIVCTCPHCKTSLIDGDHVRFQIVRADGERGELRLSPFLNVFESTLTIGVPDGEEAADLVCPTCSASLRSDERCCDECKSKAAKFLARVDDEDVDFYICLRKSCRWHGVSEQTRSRMILEASGFHHPDRHEELIKTGTKLQCSCPNCSGDLVKGDDLTLEVSDPAGNPGTLILSPYLNVFRAECNLVLKRGEQLQIMACPSCKGSLFTEGRNCELCGGRTARFRVKTAKSYVEFFICARRSCHWHGLDDDSRRRIMLDRP